MSFPDDVIKDAWELVEGKCECGKPSHQHPDVRCNKHLLWEKQNSFGWGSWKAHPIDGIAAHNTLSNCEILCWSCIEKG
jgi:hypothetical protein